MDDSLDDGISGLVTARRDAAGPETQVGDAGDRREPDHYHCLDAVRSTAFEMFARGVRDRRSACHTVTLGTIAADGAPSVRVVVLRGFDAEARSLRFHTDIRSRKIYEIAANPVIAVHAYDPVAKIQIRLTGRAQVHVDDAVQASAWQATRSFSRACYRTEPSPGAEIPDGGAFAMPGADDPDAGLEHFRAVVMRFDRLEWLYLAAGGHRRALFLWSDESEDVAWLVP